MHKDMAISHSEIPKFLVSQRYISAVITLIVIFSILFMMVYEPFSLAVWFSTKDIFGFSLTILFYVASVIILVLSRTLMYLLQDRIEINIINFIWWLMSENLLISILYTAITVRYFPQMGVTFSEIGIRAFMCVTFILGIPNAIVSFYASYRSRCEELDLAYYELQRLRDENKMLRESSEQQRLVAVSQKSAEQHPRMVQLHDYNGTMRITVTIDSLYYVQSEDNYVNIYYKYNDKILNYMLRCKTSDLERSLHSIGMVRCHRSYIVNIHKIASINTEHGMRYAILNDESIKHIPISKRYYDSLIEAIAIKA